MPLPPNLAGNPRLMQLWAALPDARIVGGAVRDTLAGRPVSDVDFSLPRDPEAVAADLGRAGIRAIPTGITHGTITALVDGTHFEITSLRRDIETDGRHAVIGLTDDWRVDAARRDFTINAMSMDRTGTVFDYFSGREDLRAGIIRFVGDAEQRIREDYLRILRFFRFFARYALGAPDNAAIRAIAANLDGLSRLSAERVWSELKRILAAPDPSRAVELMEETGVLERILRGGASPARLIRAIGRGMPADPLARFAALVTAPIGGIADRLRFAEAERDVCAAIEAAPVLAPDAPDTALLVALADHARDALIAKTYFAEDDADRADLRARLAAMEPPVFPLRGRDALALGVEPGPPIGDALSAVRSWWLAEGCAPGVEECRARLAAELGRLDPMRQS